MTKEIMRKCSHCRRAGHNSRSCNKNSSFLLFGVRITPNNHQNNNNTNKGKKLKSESIRKSKSTGSLQTANKNNADHDGYLSDDMLPVRRTHEQRNKGVMWTIDEHRAFLLGLEKRKKGDWKGISNHYVPTRSATQVASHAQKYFIWRNSPEKKKRRASVFDIPLHEPVQIASYSTPFSLQLGNGRNTSLMNTGITPIQFGSAGASTSKNTSNFPGIRAATSESTLVRPIATRAYGYCDFPYVRPNIVGCPPSSEQSFGAAKYKQVASCFPELSYVYATHGHGIFPVIVPSVSNDQLFAKSVPDGSSTRASVMKNDCLAAEIGALAL